MGLADKKRDTLVSIQGKSASKYRNDVALLIAGELPPGWQAIPSSDETFVAYNKKTHCYYKEFLPRNIFEKLKAFFRGSRCQRALKQTAILQKEGLPTPDILCWGKGGQNTFLISEGFKGVGFFKYLTTNFRPPLNNDKFRKKRKLLKEAGFLIGEMHTRGIVHGDLRQNNLLVLEDENSFLFSFIDIERNHKWRFIPRSQLLKNLIQFSIFSDNLLTKTDLMRLYKAYATLNPRFSNRARKRFFLKKVFRQSKIRILSIKFKKMLKDTSYSYKYKNFQGKYRKNSIVSHVLSSGIDPAQWFSASKTELKNDKNTSVRLLQVPQGKIIAKRFAVKNIVFHPGCWSKIYRAQRQWEMSHIFMALEIPVACPLGFVIERNGILTTSSYYFSEYLDNAKDLVCLSREIENFHAWLKRNNIISRFALSLAKLHNSGYCHGDTKWANILANASTGKFWFIDLDGTSRSKLNLGPDICKDLSRFTFDMIKYNLPKDFQDEFMDVYCTARILNKKLVQKKITPIISRINNRHKKKSK